ncbi:hypothetical protein DdX_17946 [Ditylenchus destructor]|uniref:DUF4291 domain-containing protein n=1 Tax=Ditylenchus destructor TaxID=166010 RepID=A0AAD4QYK2_9BILA|nr:hypothetical protein DdX_17946 [Ditylenchus destructor]
MNIPMELYIQAQSHLPESGKHILAQQTTDRIVVYQAYNNEIANFALANGHFGGPKFSLERMSWIKPGFMWMMYRSGWATKPNQERVLAIYLGKERFEEILLRSVSTSFHSNSQYPNREDWNKALQTSDVLLQWDPDHDPQGGKLERRAVQVGLRGDTLKEFVTDWIERIEDVTKFVKDQKIVFDSNEWDKLLVPVETVFKPSDEQICERIGLSIWNN